MVSAEAWALLNKTLLIRNVRQMDIFHNKLVPYTVNRKNTNFDKHTSLLQNAYIMNLQCFIVQALGQLGWMLMLEGEEKGQISQQ